MRAYEILNSNEEKQHICSLILGCTFKDIEKAMESIISERVLTESQIEMMELSKNVPEKFDDEEILAPREKQPLNYCMISKEETNELVRQSLVSKVSEEKSIDSISVDYSTYSEEETFNLINFGGSQWGTASTIEYEIKINSTKKHTKRTKNLKK